jgi:hypothetical protein
MDVRELFSSQNIDIGDHVEISGWMIDANNGLFVLGDHCPENYDYPHRVKVANGNIIYPILQEVPSLGGGRSYLFYRVKVSGVLECKSPWIVKVEGVAIEADRGSNHYETINIDKTIIDAYVEKLGNYKFNRSRDPMGDWLMDY